MSGYSGLAIISLVLSLIFFIPFLSVIAIILGIVALVQIKKTKQQGKGLAIAGIVIGSLVTLGQLLMIILVVGLLSAVGNFVDSTPVDQLAYCEGLSQGTAKDLCLLTYVSANADAMTPSDIYLCDNILTADLRLLCAAIITKDYSHCSQISTLDGQQNCIEVVDALLNTTEER